ncbi:glycosyltransferase family 1 protein [Pseudomonas sp. SCB32]|uniref:glycosyltransferase family 4 protein n=1 Tax=Pseudomonas sp. SCB32 TaxID=2653853 RepID=UPI0012653809|nr:glycosyltransferase family 1 protein [Pseudomonas sp. SCB32]
MKVILSVEPVRFPLTGIGRYTYELARQLQTSPELTELRLFSGTGFVDQLPVATESGGTSHRLKRLVQNSRLATEAYRVLTPILKRRALRGYGDYLYHGPNFYLPPFAGRSVATFHDLSPFLWSDCAPMERVRYMQKELRLALERGSAFITDSEFNRQELISQFSLSPEKVHSVPLAASEEFLPRSEQDIAPTLARHNLTYDGYSLYVGTIEPRKNLLNLLEAYRKLPIAVRQRWPLILTGYAGWRSQAIHEAIGKGAREGWARYLGFAPAADLPHLFAGARLFCFPSLYEGFGLPVLEAMQSGVPVVCSDSSSLPEVAGEAALACAPADVDGMAGLLLRGLEDEAWRQAAKVAGITQAAKFSWKRCALETQRVYKLVLSK